MPTHRDLPDDRRDDTDEEDTGVRTALRALLLTFLVIVAALLFMYSVWVFAEVFLGPADVQYQDCSQLPVAQRESFC
ncbi:hypothetical protein SEA_NOSHOW_39 [Mycobacterium phage NoShow]|nr:hypothetical protein SEA_NOSHOW_39 [Mycobacterium phage NoShow]